MEDDLIDDSGFELGMPTRVEMLKHQCDLLCAELETTRRDLRKSHQNIARLIVMHRDSSTELAALKVEHERLRWTLSDIYRRESERETARMNYQYGDHTNRTKVSSRSNE
ncbi:hypothetical protein D3C85_1362440 [compost metagenome]